MSVAQTDALPGPVAVGGSGSDLSKEGCHRIEFGVVLAIAGGDDDEDPEIVVRDDVADAEVAVVFAFDARETVGSSYGARFGVTGR